MTKFKMPVKEFLLSCSQIEIFQRYNIVNECSGSYLIPFDSEISHTKVTSTTVQGKSHNMLRPGKLERCTSGVHGHFATALFSEILLGRKEANLSVWNIISSRNYIMCPPSVIFDCKLNLSNSRDL